MDIPTAFCWTRFGTEAGEGVGSIFERKNLERQRNGGVFLWGVGNSVGPSVAKLLQAERCPKVIFSPIRSEPRACDVAPSKIAVWTHAIGVDGRPFQIPAASIVTSRMHGARKRTHYAIVCSAGSLRPLNEADRAIRLGDLANLKTGRPIGPSQVTAIVEHRPGERGGSDAIYPITLIADLIYPYFVRLERPVQLTPERHEELLNPSTRQQAMQKLTEFAEAETTPKDRQHSLF